MSTGYNSSYKKLAGQWLNEVSYFAESSVVAVNFVLRNRQLLLAAKRCGAFKKNRENLKIRRNRMTKKFEEKLKNVS